MAVRLRERGVAPGDRVGVRVPSGTVDLYIAILGVLAAGAAYVPVDADDPDERARLVFGEAEVRAVIGEGLRIKRGDHGPGGHSAGSKAAKAAAAATAATAAAAAISAQTTVASTGAQPPVPGAGPEPGPGPGPGPNPTTPPRPTPADDAWIIFTSGSTGKPKGVAVTHRNAAAFVDAEARLFLAGAAPSGPGDRVLAGLSVAFDASCEEMWLAWRHGAAWCRRRARWCAPAWTWVRGWWTAASRSCRPCRPWPRSGRPRRWTTSRLLIFGGEACPPELADAAGRPGAARCGTPTARPRPPSWRARRRSPGRARCGSGCRWTGWELRRRRPGRRAGGRWARLGELVIGGVGPGPLPGPGQRRREVRPAPSARLGARLPQRRPGARRARGPALRRAGPTSRSSSAAAGSSSARSTPRCGRCPASPGRPRRSARPAGGHQLLVGYVVPRRRSSTCTPPGSRCPPHPARRAGPPARRGGRPADAHLRQGRPGRPALAAARRGPAEAADYRRREPAPTRGWPVLGWTSSATPRATSSPTAAPAWRRPGWCSVAADPLPRGHRRATSTTTRRCPGSPAHAVDTDGPGDRAADRIARAAGAGRDHAGGADAPAAHRRRARWVIMLGRAEQPGGRPGRRRVSWWAVLAGCAGFRHPAGRIALAAGGARLLLRGRRTRRLSARRRHTCGSGAPSSSPSSSACGGGVQRPVAHPLRAGARRPDRRMTRPALDAAGNRHARLGEDASVEPEVDLSGYWIDGDRVRVGEIRSAPAPRSAPARTLLPGAKIGKNAQVAPGSAVAGSVPSGQRWAGVPAAGWARPASRRPGRRARAPGAGSRPTGCPRWSWASSR